MRLLLAISLIALISGCSTQQESSSWPEKEVSRELRERIETARDKFISLAEAVPEEAWDYRPMEGTRSFGEVFIHIAADNYAPMWSSDMPQPEGVEIEATRESFEAYQAEARPKEETLTELRNSFDYLLNALQASEGKMDSSIPFFGNEWMLGDMWIALTTHMHEHLGQTIAYARANEIVPPWSR